MGLQDVDLKKSEKGKISVKESIPLHENVNPEDHKKKEAPVPLAELKFFEKSGQEGAAAEQL